MRASNRHRINQALERSGPVAGDPVDHVTAVRRAERGGARAIEEAVFASANFQPFCKSSSGLPPQSPEIES